MSRAALVVVALALVLGNPSPAHAQAGGERIEAFAFDVVIADDGTLRVTETIQYDFGSAERHGIFRDIPTRLTYDDRYDRVYRLRDVVVSSETAPDGLAQEGGSGGTTRLRIGDADKVVTGRHTYRITYTLDGALNAFDDHVELYWNAIGSSWEVPIDDVTVSVTAPVDVVQTACFAGAEGSSLPCDERTAEGRRAGFTHAHLEPFQALSFVVSIPPGSVTATGPILEERWSAQRAFAVTPATVGTSLTLLVLVLAGVGALVWRVGRDRRVVGSAIDVAFADATAGGHERVPLLGGNETPVEYEPPDKLRPGQIGTLVDERANPLDVTATIVDLAVRGYLRIEEIPKDGWFGKPDWRLVRLEKRDDELLDYERMLLDGLFETGDEVELSDLKNRFAARLKKVQAALYEDAVHRKWFTGSPEATRTHWILIGLAVLIAGVALTVVTAMFTRLGIVPLPIVVGGILLLALSGRMPHRTPAGTGVLVRTLGFKRFIDESEKDRARFAEQQHLFTEYLPYAIVFGATERWARAFAGLDGELPDQSSWYVSNNAFTFMTFNSAMDGFATTSAGTIASTPSGSGTSGFGGGGFSGGGGGGGGGGSW
ncbi:MAG TPA: DUF2207 domain-containing protein [Acidimicrobiales bacterium]|nr:DUF2207 domain-containing protein [Acidimicrobiales bacterium]